MFFITYLIHHVFLKRDKKDDVRLFPSDDEDVLPLTNTTIVEENTRNNKNMESYYELPIRFKRSKKKSLHFVPKINKINTIDESTDDDIDLSQKNIDPEFDYLFDDEAKDDSQHVDCLTDETTYDLPHLNDFDDNANDDYDYSDSFINDEPSDDHSNDSDSHSDI
ncbi:hypothetical protein Tco_1161971 [Tanacetum coccineum]